ncbi:MAG TPA: extracellular solute-binding protein, partial [Thermotogota bacterium]|nr:extracellular solute-binding protein [Thermotogota bacterium]
MKKALLILVLVGLIALTGFSATKIQFWHAMGGWRIDMLNEMAQDFMKLNPDIVVDVQYTGSYDETLNKLVAGIQAGTAPHVIQNFEIATQKMIDGEIAVVMQDLIDKDPTFDMGKFLPQVLNYYRVNGKLYCMPFNSSNPVMFYNKTLFEKAGLDPNKPPRTFSELYEYAKKLTVKDAAGNIIQSGIT